MAAPVSEEPIMNYVFDAASTNIAVRRFQPNLIRKDELKTILEAARLTQSAKNLQPWYFIVIEDRTLDRIADTDDW